MNHDHNLFLDENRLAVSPQEQRLLERFDGGQLLVDLQDLYRVNITVGTGMTQDRCHP